MQGSEIARTVGGAASGIASMTGVGAWLSPIISLATTGIGAGLEASEAADQKSQAEKLRKEALNMKPAALTPEYMQKLNAEKFAELGGLPGKLLWQNMLDARTANDVRAIRESSPNGAATLAAASGAMGKQADSLNQLAMQDADYRAQLAKNTRNTLWDIGGQKDIQTGIRDVKQRDSLTAASALENAGTFNKMNAINKGLGAVSSTVSAIGANAQAKEDDAKWMDFLKTYYGMNNQATQPTTESSGFGQFTDFSSGATLPSSTNMFSPLNYPMQ